MYHSNEILLFCHILVLCYLLLNDSIDKVRITGGNDLQSVSIGVGEFAQNVPSTFNVEGVANAGAQSYTDPECVQSVSGNNLAAPAMLQFAKTRKLSVERSDPRK